MPFYRRFPLKPPQLAPTIKPPTPEELKKGKGFPTNAVIWTEEAFQALQRFLRDHFQVTEGGLPAGAYEGAPTLVTAGDSGSPGAVELGWAPGTHKHPVSTGAAVELTPISSSTEGGATSLARSDHTHDMTKVMADVLAKVSLGL